MSLFETAVSFIRGSAQRDVFVRQGIPAENLVGPYGGLLVDQSIATKVVAIQSAWSLLADAVSGLPIDVGRKVGRQRIPIERPAWLDTPDPFDPSYTMREHVGQTVVSLAADGNCFTMVTPDVSDIASVRVVSPQRVKIKSSRGIPRYEYRPAEGGLEVLGPDQMLHISRTRRPGELRGMSPVEEATTSLSRTLAADRFGGRVLTNGMLIAGALTVPGPLLDEQLSDLRTQIENQYTGIQAGKFGIFGNGATFGYPTLDLEKMALLALLRWGVLDVGRIYHIPPHLMGDNEPGSVSYKSVEQQYIEFTEFGYSPYCYNIEAGYARLLSGDGMTLPVDGSYMRFNLNAKVRADLKTRMEAYGAALQNKITTRDEVRALEDLEPADDAAGVDTENGGWLETPNNNYPYAQTGAAAPATDRPALNVVRTAP